MTAISPDQVDSSFGVESFIHDLRNQLNAIHGSAELLVRSDLSQAQVRRIARNVYSASIRMRELLEQCLERSRFGGRAFEICDLRHIIASAVDWVAFSAELQSVHIEQDVPEGMLISMDRNRIHRVLVNLLMNSMEVMPQGGMIHVSAVWEPRSVSIRVRDNGPGIPPEMRERLFEPFVTAGKANGTGLGLFFSRQTAIDHGGEIWAESPRQGACFVLRLPIPMAICGAASC